MHHFAGVRPCSIGLTTWPPHSPFSDTIPSSLGSIKRNIFTLYSGKYYTCGLLSLDKLSSIGRTALNTACSLVYLPLQPLNLYQRRNLYHRKNSFPNRNWYTNQLHEATNQNILMTFNHIYSSLMLNVLNILRLSVEHSAPWRKNSLYFRGMMLFSWEKGKS